MSIKQPRYPVYVISKGRYEPSLMLTAKTLEEIKCDYNIVVEPQEVELYKKSGVIKRGNIIALPEGFRNNPEWARPGNAGTVGGSIPARNFVWEHSIKEGHARHWIIDDNIRDFYRSHRNTRLIVRSPVPLRVCEDFTDRFENVKMSGLNYNFFVPANIEKVPYYLNTRIYSCTLLANDIPFRWRGKFNEDTRLSLDILKAGYCTVLLNAFSAGKAASSAKGWGKGGNTEIYKETNGRLEFVEELKLDHPDVVELTQKWGRWHHHVDYSPFMRNKLIPKKGLVLNRAPNEYGLKLVRLDKHRGKPIQIIDTSKEFSIIT